jgi:hypothetical protein
MSYKPLLSRVTLREALEFAAQRTIAREMDYGEGVMLPGEHQGGVQFTDGSVLVCVTEYGFRGSDVTPPDPAEVAFYVYDGQPQAPR